MKNLWVLFYRRWRKVTAFFAKGWLDQPSQTSTQVCENRGFQTQESSCLNSALNEMIYYSLKWKPSEIPFLLCLRKTACFQTSYIKQRPLSTDTAQSPRHPPSVFLHLCKSRRQSCGGPRKLRLPSGGGRSPSGLAVFCVSPDGESSVPLWLPTDLCSVQPFVFIRSHAFGWGYSDPEIKVLTVSTHFKYIP